MKSTATLNNLVNSFIIKHEENPFFIVDIQDILWKYENWILNLPRVRPFFAIKCNNIPLILEILNGLGVGFDCASKVEIDTILSMDVPPSKIVYANPCKTRSFIKHAAANGVDLMTFDNEDELYKIASIFPHARLLIRIKVDDSHAVCRFSAKFGVPLEKCSALLSIARSLCLRVVGVSFHVGSGCENARAYADAISNARYVFTIAKEMGFQMSILDIGGGFPGAANAVISFEDIASVINHSLETHFPENDIDIIAEPGRYFVSSAFTLFSAVIAKRVNITDNNEKSAMYYLNDGVYGSFNCTIFDHMEIFPSPYPKNNSQTRDLMMTTLWGPTCDSMDMIKKDFLFPELDVGDWISFPDMGAYTIVAASNFNGFSTPSLNYYSNPYTIKKLKKLKTWKNIAKILDMNEENQK